MINVARKWPAWPANGPRGPQMARVARKWPDWRESGAIQFSFHLDIGSTCACRRQT